MASAHKTGAARRSGHGLDWLNFFVADVQTGFGPFVSVYLASQHWSTGEIGLVLGVGGVAGIVSQLPGGALVDAVSGKRLLVAGALAVLAAGALLFAFWPGFWPVMLAELLIGGTAGVLRPALAAIGLGLVGHDRLSSRLGRNQRFNSFGTATTAAAMGLLGHYTAAMAMPFFIAAALCLPAIAAVALIDGRDIDYANARSSGDRDQPRRGRRLREMARLRALHVFMLSLALFQFANASLVPLASARLGYQSRMPSELVVAGFVVVPQIVAALLATPIARQADRRGHKPLLIAGIGAVAARAAVFAATAMVWILVPVQVLDGLSAAVVGIMTPLVTAELARGTGRYNLTQGTVGAATGIAAALSTGVTGYLVQYLGFTAGFVVLGTIALLGCAVLYWFLPETRSASGGPRSAPEHAKGRG